MTACASSIEELQDLLARRHAARKPAPSPDISRLCRILEHHPEDLTCTVECGIPLAQLQRALARHGQWLPIDPPHPSRVTLADVIHFNLSGPRRLGHGTIRDHLIGLDVVLADGTRVRSGGRVVKNVAGYDLHKVFVGARGCLGVPVIANLRLLPLPAAAALLECVQPDLPAALRLAAAARRRFQPVALDVHRTDSAGGPCTVSIEFAGAAADVDLQRGQAEAMGFDREGAPGWDERLLPEPGVVPSSFSVPPSRLHEAADPLAGRRFVIRAGIGLAYHDGPPIPALQPSAPAPRFLLERLKAALDPNAVLPPLP